GGELGSLRQVSAGAKSDFTGFGAKRPSSEGGAAVPLDEACEREHQRGVPVDGHLVVARVCLDIGPARGCLTAAHQKPGVRSFDSVSGRRTVMGMLRGFDARAGDLRTVVLISAVEIFELCSAGVEVVGLGL